MRSPRLPVAAAALLLAVGHALAQSTWPKVELPKDVSAFNVGELVTVNGLPMRMQAFDSVVKPGLLAERFRKSLGKPLVENVFSNKLILGRAEGEHYISVQLEPAGTGTRGVIAVTQLKTAYANRSETRSDSERLLSRLPSGSRVISRMGSSDGGKLARHVLFTNTHNEDLNRDRLTDMMREDGMALEREASADNKAGHQSSAALLNGRILFFKGTGKEAMAVISRDGTGRTSVVLNTINFMEDFK